MLFRRNKEIDIRKTLDLGLRLFHVGNRKESMAPLKKVLEEVPHIPSYRLAASTLLAEIYRGMGDFSFAESYYQLGLKECEKIPSSQRIQNEWYSHYRPRGEIGLLVVMRRNLSDKHSEIAERFSRTRSELTYLKIPDLTSQINLIEGLYLRQLGFIDDSVNRIEEGLGQLENVEIPHNTIFLEKEHFEALLILSYLCDPGRQIWASKLARKVLDEELSPWCMSISCIALIHLTFRRIFQSLTPNGVVDPSWIEDTHERVENLLALLRENAEFEQDPLLISESGILELIWMGMKKDDDGIRESLIRLSKSIEDACEATILLRNVELASIYPLIHPCISKDSVASLFKKGITTLNSLQPNLLSYNCRATEIDFWRQLMNGERVGVQHCLQDWNSPSVQKLRAVTWP